MFYDRLKSACDMRNIAISAAVKSVTSSSGMIDGWKKGSYPRADMVRKLADSLNVSADYLLERTVNPEQISEFQLDSSECAFIKRIRMIDESTRAAVFRLADAVMAGQEMSSPKVIPFSSNARNFDHATSERRRGERRKRVEGETAAGAPISAISEDDMTIRVPSKYDSDNYFIVRARGDSMVKAGIRSGDHCIFQADAYRDPGSIMYVQLESDTDVPECLIKRVFPHGNQIELRSANPKYAPMFYPAEQISLNGVLVDVIPGDGR